MLQIVEETVLVLNFYEYLCRPKIVSNYINMKKFIMILAAMVCLTGCMTSSEDVIYSLNLTMVKDEFSVISVSNSSADAVVSAHEQIVSKLSDFSRQYTKSDWIETVHNGKFSKTDKNAKALYNSAASALESLQEECEAIVKNIPAVPGCSFKIVKTLVLSRYNDAKDNVLEEMDFSISYDGDNGNNAAI